MAGPSLLAGLLTIGLLAPAGVGAAERPAALAGEITRIRRVIDGDTVVTETGARIRYIGIDTPEIHHPRRPVECLGPEAAALNRKLVEGKMVVLAKDTRDTDRYGRRLRYVYLPDAERRPGLFVNEELVARGLARARLMAPDLEERRRLLAAQRKARASRRGIWGLPPSRPRGMLRHMVLADRLRGTYHRPGTQTYEILRCRPEIWMFSSPEEAERAGLREGKPQ